MFGYFFQVEMFNVRVDVGIILITASCVRVGCFISFGHSAISVDLAHWIFGLILQISFISVPCSLISLTLSLSVSVLRRRMRCVCFVGFTFLSVSLNFGNRTCGWWCCIDQNICIANNNIVDGCRSYFWY